MQAHFKLHTQAQLYVPLNTHIEKKNKSLNTQTAMPVSLRQPADNKQFIFLIPNKPYSAPIRSLVRSHYHVLHPSTPSKCTYIVLARRGRRVGGVGGGAVLGAKQFKKCIHAPCQQIRSLMQIEFTINPPGAAIEEEKGEKKKKKRGKKTRK